MFGLKKKKKKKTHKDKKHKEPEETSSDVVFRPTNRDPMEDAGRQ